MGARFSAIPALYPRAIAGQDWASYTGRGDGILPLTVGKRRLMMPTGPWHEGCRWYAAAICGPGFCILMIWLHD